MKPMRHIISTLAIIILGMAVMGCAFFDWNNDGKIDPIAYLQDADISVTWVDDQGNAYTMDVMELGQNLFFAYVEQKTGYRFDLAEQQDGSIGIRIRDPKGYEIYIVPQVQPPDPDPVP